MSKIYQLKLELIKRIIDTDDLPTLKKVEFLLSQSPSSYLIQEPEIEFKAMDKELKASLQRSEKDIEEGRIYPNDEVENDDEEWLD